MPVNSNNDSPSDLAEIYQVAHMYYDENMLQSEIADKLYLSRPKVSRMLTQARELGIVEIQVHPVIDRLPSVEKKLCEFFGLKDAIVIATHPNHLEKMEEMLQNSAVHYVNQLIKKGGILGVTNSPTINAILGKLSFSEDYETDIVQLMGETSSSYSTQDTTLVLTRLSGQLDKVKMYSMAVPVYVNDLYLKEVLLQQPAVHEVLQKATQCDLALTGISTLENDADYQIRWNGLMGPHHHQELIDNKAVGGICAQYFDIRGVKVTSEWNSKTIAMNLNDFAKIKTRIGVAQGLDKIKPVWGALRGKLINVLITDSNTAGDLIEFKEQ